MEEIRQSSPLVAFCYGNMFVGIRPLDLAGQPLDLLVWGPITAGTTPVVIEDSTYPRLLEVDDIGLSTAEQYLALLESDELSTENIDAQYLACVAEEIVNNFQESGREVSPYTALKAANYFVEMQKALALDTVNEDIKEQIALRAQQLQRYVERYLAVIPNLSWIDFEVFLEYLKTTQ